MVCLPIYMDNNATTRPDPRVVDAMLPYFSEHFGNPASQSHSFGWAADEAVSRARAQIASLINADTREIVFTSGATESDNLALKGVAEMYARNGNHIVTAVTEHAAVLDTARRLESQGLTVTYLPVDHDGLIDLDQLSNALTGKTILVSIMLANNEIGTIQPIEEIGRICREKGVLFHSDATQGVGKVPVDVERMNIDLMSFTAHKMYGPKGVGALYVRRANPRVRLTPQIDGGGHEGGMRSGTLNVPGIVGFGKAAELCRAEMKHDQAHTLALRDKLSRGILNSITGSRLNGHPTQRLPNSLNISFAEIEAEALQLRLPDVALSGASACSSSARAPSHVLSALGLGDDLAYGALRFGLSRYSTGEEVDYVVEKLQTAVAELMGAFRRSP